MIWFWAYNLFEKKGKNLIYSQYYIEISKAAEHRVQEDLGYIRRQTLTNNERFISPEFKEKEDAILQLLT